MASKPLTAKLNNTRRVAWLFESWERFWPLVLPLFCVIALFLTLSWMGVWPSVSNQIRLILLGLFAVSAGVALLPLFKFRFPTRRDVDHRIEQQSELTNQPITTRSDNPAKLGAKEDPAAHAMWVEHQRRMANKLRNLKSGKPDPKIARYDVFGLRALVGLFLFIGLAAGWGELSSRIGDAFRPHHSAALSTARIDAWVTPPGYTNRPPIFLSNAATTASADRNKPVTVPEGSELVIRVLDLENPMVELVFDEGQSETISPSVSNSEGAKKQSADQKLSQTFKVKLGKTSSARLNSGSENARQWSFTILPDHDPSIEFVETPKGSSRSALEFSFKVQDDYGIKSAEAEISSTQPEADDAVPLIDAPTIKLPLPGRKSKTATLKTSQDLTAHPWAGSEVSMMLVARDEAGQVGKSAVEKFFLPQRVFTKPLALAIVDERRKLAMNVKAAPKVAEMLNIITTNRPEMFLPDIAVYTALRVSYRMIKRAENNDELREAIDLLWETALAVEDGDLSRAERRLRDAQEKLSEALENGASDEEIDKLMKELRQAMNEFLQELAEQMAKNQQNQQAMPSDPNIQTLRQQDIERMMKQIEDLAKSGSRDAARQLLQEMQRMMNNLQTAQPNQQQRQQSDEFSRQMDKLGDMMRQQQQLMDDTFKMQRRQQQQQQQNGGQQQGDQNQSGEKQQGGQKPMTPEEFSDAMKQLQQQQGELQKQMQGLQEGLKDLGLEPGKLGDAGKAMGDAEGKLGKQTPGPATGDQGRALQAMREGAQQMMREMQNQAGEQGRQGERGQHGQQSRQDRDPLGRQSQSNGPQLGDDTKVPDEIDAQRAREILEAIRRKLGEITRPKLELDYLDRLLPTR